MSGDRSPYLRNLKISPIILVKVLLAKQCTTTKKTMKTQPLELYKVASSQGTTTSPGTHRIRMGDGDGSHHELGNASSRVSKENEVEDES